jgi:membrane fusion protein (multidrug efflux system)
MSILSPAAIVNRLVPPSLRLTLRRTALGLAVLAGGAVGAHAAYGYWTEGRFKHSTDDAHVHADYTTVVPRVSGYLTEVLVRDNETVMVGQVLARIDDRDFRVALDQAEADVQTADASLVNLDAQITQQQSVVDQKRAEIAADKAMQVFAEADNERYENLKKSGYASVQRAQQAEAQLRERIAHLRKSRAGLITAERQIDVLVSERARVAAQRERSLAARRQAELNLSYASIRAPVAGVVGARTLREGQYLQAGTPLMALVPLHAVYVIANFKETQLAAVRPGQPVRIEIDTFPGVVLRGQVDSVAPASGREFTLLPAENVSGNFTKIVQRVPVKVRLADDGPLAGQLRAGMSVRATIDVRFVP